MTALLVAIVAGGIFATGVAWRKGEVIWVFVAAGGTIWALQALGGITGLISALQR